MFRTDLLSIIRSLNTVVTAIGICHAEIFKMDKITSVYIHIYVLCSYLVKHAVGKTLCYVKA